jgi:hypothetical protein
MTWRWLPETAIKANRNSSLSQFFSQTLISYKSILSHGLFLRFMLGGLFAYGVVIAYNISVPPANLYSNKIIYLI